MTPNSDRFQMTPVGGAIVTKDITARTRRSASEKEEYIKMAQTDCSERLFATLN